MFFALPDLKFEFKFLDGIILFDIICVRPAHIGETENGLSVIR